MSDHRERSRPLAPIAVVACLALAPNAGAVLVERCSWPPPGGPAVAPDSVQVEVPPLVADLDADGTPEIVFLSFRDGTDDGRGQDGVLRILDGRDCSEIASTADLGCVTCFGESGCGSLDLVGEEGVFCAACTPAVADLDGDGQLEIVALSEGGGGSGRRPVILDHRGELVRCGEAATESIGNVAALALADLEADGEPEILARDACWRATGELAWEDPLSAIGATIAVDLDGDAILEVVNGQDAFRADGTVFWEGEDLGGASPAVADLDLDCRPDLVVTARDEQTINVVDPLTGEIRASAPLPVGDCPPRSDGQGGPPTLADVDGDCVPEIGVAGCRRYSLFRYDAGPPESLELAWTSPIDDSSSRFTGSTIFDLDGDGSAEILYNDHDMLRIYDGLSGAVEAELPNSTTTLLELPVVADADADGAADVLVAANDYTFCCNAGVRVLVDDAVRWAPVRPLFNQHSYHVTNILDDGRLPRPEEPSWERQNTYRVQGPPLREPSGPRLVGVPPDATVGCRRVPPPAEPTAEGGCGERPEVELEEVEVELDCADRREVRRTWTATDRCGRTDVATQVVTVVDEEPPSLEGAPADVAIGCDEPIPEPPELEATDACDPDPRVELEEERLPGPCPGDFTLLRTWTAFDRCGLASEPRTQVITVSDDEPPRLLGLPDDLVVECDAVPPPPAVSAEDACDPDPVVSFSETRVDGSCPNEYRLVRTWRAVDACDNEVTAVRTVEVVDTTPPRLVSAPERACLWPPNHWVWCFDPDEVFDPIFEDSCPGEITWELVACESDQPVNDVGDGDFAPDCWLEDDGRVCVRAERQGTVPEGRHYGLLAVAVDACGNASEPELVGDVDVPHDQSPHRDCLKSTVVATRHRGDRSSRNGEE